MYFMVIENPEKSGEKGRSIQTAEYLPEGGGKVPVFGAGER
ncbi:MAG: hypothetical protein O7E57_09225 [Gammaproteobacteria bacterium]|nr:hypothetical protein [Gammaproteobacteria bacterium]